MNSQLPSNNSIELITIGREILDGRVVDTNAVNMAQILGEKGLLVRHAQKVDDIEEDIVAAFELAQSRSRYVLVTGGLGPTSDDITLEALAKFMKVELAEDEEALAHLKVFLESRSLTMTPAQRKQALFPNGTKLLSNQNGTALGCHATLKADQNNRECEFFCMPGVPSEMLPMLKTSVLAKLPAKKTAAYRWATHFVPEAHLQDKLSDLKKNLPSWIELNFRTRFPENHVALFAEINESQTQKEFDQWRAQVDQHLEEDCFFQGTELRELEEIVVTEATKAKCWLASVESCTGGQIISKLTSVSGASACAWGSWTTYDNKAKELIGVPEKIIAQHGAVSEECAVAMALCAFQQWHSNPPADAEKFISVSSTGVAGPTGGSPEKPVGSCFIGITTWTKGSEPQTRVLKIQARPGLTRAKYQQYFTQKALNEIRLALTTMQ